MEKFTFTRRNITVITSYLLFTAIFFILGLLIGFKNGDDPIIKEVSSVTQNIPEFTPVPFTTPSPSHYRVILEDGKLRLYIDENGVSRLVSQEEISEDSYPVADITSLKKGIVFETADGAISLMENFIS